VVTFAVCQSAGGEATISVNAEVLPAGNILEKTIGPTVDEPAQDEKGKPDTVPSKVKASRVGGAPKSWDIYNSHNEPSYCIVTFTGIGATVVVLVVVLVVVGAVVVLVVVDVLVEVDVLVDVLVEVDVLVDVLVEVDVLVDVDVLVLVEVLVVVGGIVITSTLTLALLLVNEHPVLHKPFTV
jgi:hypothetical protein